MVWTGIGRIDTAIAASVTPVPVWLSLLSLPTMIGGHFTVLGLVIDRLPIPAPPFFATWGDAAQVVGYCIGTVAYGFALAKYG